MEDLGNVQQKIPCVFETRVVEEVSTKRRAQPYRVVASDIIRQAAEKNNIHNARPTEKLDGTCVHIREFDSKPWLWARLDRKPHKIADKRFKKFQTSHRDWEAGGQIGIEPSFSWDFPADFKDVPADWIPANGVPLKADGTPVPDENAHIPGWVPLEPKSRQYCWHLDCVDMEYGLGLVLRPLKDGQGDATNAPSCQPLELALVPLHQLLDTTLELIGTNINGNPYHIGKKQAPLHMMVRHGSIPIHGLPVLDYSKMKEWFVGDHGGAVEGVVWHCQGGCLFKLHRHHVGLKWPPECTRLQCCPVVVNVDLTQYEAVTTENNLFITLSKIHGQTYKSLSEIDLPNFM